ncbi:hypothetical protein SAMN02746065_10910 [Desulfocicer vacuolatum DSM 3385]|uniref:Uncharacterized protein n=1 Tax=Desulfocicer vacuolatum DSM 3385 TaxID=1121400 RepID=A0A1W2BNN2_9BACT|nr:hypothetical protein [Desulfocicer vacuolatum]SMC74527.1 hypothetical protein SAMN02746065_10910 [Desulfocicer vacuolatum DSM 3385]
MSIKTPERSQLRLQILINFMKKQETDLNKELAMSPEVYQGMVEMLTKAKDDYEHLMFLAKKRQQVWPGLVALDPQEVMPKILRGL